MGKNFFAVSGSLLRRLPRHPKSGDMRDFARRSPGEIRSSGQKTADLDAPIQVGRALKIRREEGFSFNKKTSTLPKGELRIAPCFLGPQSQSLAASANGSVNTYTGRSSDSRIILLPAPSPPRSSKWPHAGVVPGYSGGTVTDSHRLPFYPEGTCTPFSIICHRLLSRA
jgi:hypothetical protein